MYFYADLQPTPDDEYARSLRTQNMVSSGQDPDIGRFLSQQLVHF